jgi:hypothetical protein
MEQRASEKRERKRVSECAMNSERKKESTRREALVRYLNVTDKAHHRKLFPRHFGLFSAIIHFKKKSWLSSLPSLMQEAQQLLKHDEGQGTLSYSISLVSSSFFGFFRTAFSDGRVSFIHILIKKRYFDS